MIAMRKTIMRTALAALLVAGNSVAQTCSCAGAPILSSIETGAATPGRWLLGASYERHAINDVVDGSDELNNTSDRKRYSNSLLIEASYGLSSRVSLTGLLALVRHERSVSSVNGLGEDIETNGVSSGMLLMKYALLRQSPFSSREITLGLGAKFPLGSTDVTRRGVLVSEDMQPSSGSLDGILWGYFSQALGNGNATNLYLSTSFRYSGDNDRKFDSGDEFISTFGLSHATGGRFGGSAAVRYRWSGDARRDGYGLPNTGGKWLYLVPGVSVGLPSSFSLQVSAQVPLYRSLEGVQFTTSHSWKLSLYRTI
jgi:hypothetical protein